MSGHRKWSERERRRSGHDDIGLPAIARDVDVPAPLEQKGRGFPGDPCGGGVLMSVQPEFMTQTNEALSSPRPGDRFHDMFSWWTVVVAVGSQSVTVLEASGPFNLVRGKIRDHHQDGGKWVTVEPWQDRATLNHFPNCAEFMTHMRGELLVDRDLDVAGWRGTTSPPGT